MREPVRVLGAESNGAEQLGDALLSLVAAVEPMHAQRLGNDLSHGHARIQRRVRILEHDL